MGQLHDRDEKSSLLDADNRGLHERVRAQAAQISEYEAEHTAFMKERGLMREDLLRLQSEKDDALALANDWQIKFENFNTSVANEKENLVWLHYRHTRLVSSRSIYLQLDRFIAKRLTAGVGQMKFFKAFREGKSRSTFRLWHVFNRYSD